MRKIARPAKSVNVTQKNLPNNAKVKKQQVEQQIRGLLDNIKPPKYLNLNQKKIFKCIVSELKESNILGNLDIYILTTCSIAIDRLQGIETSINQSMNLLSDSGLMSSKDKYTKDLYRCCNELCLSPQSRAKMANLNLKSKEVDPLLEVLTADD